MIAARETEAVPEGEPDEALLELPPIDGASDELADEGVVVVETIDMARESEDALEDGTGEFDPVEDLETEGGEGEESGWLVDGAEESGVIEVGLAALVSLSENEPRSEPRSEGNDLAEHGAYDDFALSEESLGADGGEEGPLALDEQLRESDLPALDADEESELGDEELFDRGLMVGEEVEPAGAGVQALGLRSEATQGTFVLAGAEPLDALRRI